MTYRYLLVDLDDTLLDYRLAERLSLTETFAALGQRVEEGVYQRYNAINRELWAWKEKGIITRAQLRHQRFARLLSEIGMSAELVDEVNRIYSSRLRVHGETVEGAQELLCSLHGHMKIAAVTNGVTAVQRSRLDQTGLQKWFDAVVISEEVGLNKPDQAIIRYALRELRCENFHEAVMLGDSLEADIAAANAAGIDSIWLSQDGKVSDLATCCVRSLSAAQAFLESGFE